MNALFEKLEARWDALAVRERALVFVALLAGVIGTADSLLLRPQDEEAARLEAALAQLGEETLRLSNHSREVAAQIASGEGGPLAREEAQLREQIRWLEGQIEEHLASMIPPGEVTKMLEALLARESELKLQRLASLEPRSATTGEVQTGEESAQANPPARKPDFFRHGFRLQLEGSYLVTLQYLEAIESLSWDLSWDRMVYEVVDYPRARITIELHTLSDEEGWIGV